MRIVLIVSNLHNAGITGQQKIGLGLAERLGREGHSVLVLTNSTQPTEVAHSIRQQNVDFHVLPGEAHIWSRTALAYISAGTIRMVSRFKPDLVHTHGSYASWLGAVISRMLRKPLVQTIYDADLLGGTFGWLKRLSLDRGDRVIFTSEYLRERAGFTENAGRAIVQPYGIDEVWFNLPACRGNSERRKERTVLFWGDAAAGRGFDVLMDAVPIVCSTAPNVKFQFALRYAEEHYSSRLRSLVSDFPVGIVADRPVANIPELITKSDIIVLPYVKTTIQPPLTLLESLASGRPVVTTAVEGNAELVQTEDRIAEVIPPGDAKALAAAVVGLVEDPGKGAEMAMLAHTAMKRLCHWDIALRRITDAYHQCV